MGLTAGDPASPLLVRRHCPQAGEVWLGTLDVTLPRGPQNPAAPEGVWPASSPDVARHGPGGHSRRPAPPLALLSPSQREAALRVPPSPRAACLGLGGGGQASALAPVLCRRWAGVLASPGDVVASGGRGPPARPRLLRPRGVGLLCGRPQPRPRLPLQLCCARTPCWWPRMGPCDSGRRPPSVGLQAWAPPPGSRSGTAGPRQGSSAASGFPHRF